MADRIWRATLFFVLLNEVAAGAARYFLGNIGAGQLVYLPKILMAIYIFFSLLTCFDVVALFIACAFALAAFVGVVNGVTIPAIAFQLWIMLPLVFALLVPKNLAIYEPPYERSRTIAILFFAAVTGVVANYFVELPWIDSAFDVGNYSVEASKLSYAGDSVRLAGLGRTSASTGLILGVLAVWLICRARSWMMKWIYLGTATLALALTTNKTSILALLIVTFVHSFASNTVASRVRRVAFALQLFVPAVSVAAADYITNQPTAYSVYSSLLDRIVATWPDILTGLYKNSDLLLGRGLGGFGSATDYFSAGTTFNTEYADNIALYVMATCGIVGLVFYIFSFFKIELRCRFLLKSEASMILFLILSGITTDLPESVPCQIALGISVMSVVRGLNRDIRRTRG
ncbi:hypothetical protein [Paraburkholderia sediminicola]|uniref:hypothetical protein n=1 Tax=Paraburkholderia sediminicola TaxID=458836 RepID=UPI0038B87AB0